MTDIGGQPAGGGEQPGARQATADAAPASGTATDQRMRAAGALTSGPVGSIRREGTEPPPDDQASELLPREIVRRLDAYVIGQADAKRAVAIALRNRVRRQRMPELLRDEVVPKNILMIGPTGVGKTEIARRLARLSDSPFIKVEATKFTEVGYVGRDVESIIRDLLEQTVNEMQNTRVEDVEERARAAADERILDALVADEESRATSAGTGGDTTVAPARPAASADETAAMLRKRRLLRRRMRKQLTERRLEDRTIEIEVEESFQPSVEAFSGTGMEDVGLSLSDFFSQMTPPRRRPKRLPVAEAREVLIQEETDRLIDMDRLYDDAIRSVEESGIVFIDEIDKICGRPSSEHGPDISGEGVQRDLLPIIEGSTVPTRYGAVHTDHILFIGAGAFSSVRPSELIPEFQGRFPIRVELRPLAVDDLERILTEPSNALTKQYVGLLATERVTLEFTADGVHELAAVAARINEQDENIGARRLFTIVERVLEDLSFRAEDFAGETVPVDAAFVRRRLGGLPANEDLRKYIL